MRQHLNAIVRGRVQAVGYRYFVIDKARGLGLAGWVRNGGDGRTVELVAEGPEDRLRELESALREGPRFALVEAVDSTWSDALEGHEGFEVRW